MKTKYEVVDSQFNRENYKDLIDKILDVPPAYAQVRLVKEQIPMNEIFELQERKGDSSIENFIIRCIKAGYEQNEILNGLQEFYNQSPELSRESFMKTVVKMKNLNKNLDKMLQPKKASSNWYKKAQSAIPEQNWTPDEKLELEQFAEAVQSLERNDRNVKIHVHNNHVGDNNLFFSIISAYAIDTQTGTMWDKFTNSLYIEKIEPDLFEVNINDEGFKQYNDFETVKKFVYNFPS